MRKYTAMAILSLALALALVACEGNVPQNQEASQETVSVLVQTEGQSSQSSAASETQLEENKDALTFGKEANPEIIEMTAPPLDQEGEPKFESEADREAYVAYLNSQLRHVDNGLVVYDQATGALSHMKEKQEAEEAAESAVPPKAPMVFQYYQEMKPDRSAAYVLSPGPKLIQVTDPESLKALAELERSILDQGAVKKVLAGPFTESLFLPSGRLFEFSEDSAFIRVNGTESYDAKDEIAKMKKLLQGREIALDEQDDTGLSLSLSGPPSKSKLPLRLSSSASKDWTYTKSFAISGFAEGQFYPLRTASGTGCYRKDLLVLKGKETVDFDLELGPCLADLTPGLYRLRMSLQQTMAEGSVKGSFQTLYFFLP